MSSIERGILLAAMLAALSGCATREVGVEVYRADFGSDVRGKMDAHLVALGGDRALLGLSDDFRRSATDMINFAFDSAELDATARAILDQQAAWIARNPQVRLRIYGHTDLVGSDAYNARLGQRRAQAAAAYLAARGVSAGRLEAVASFGETRPIVPTNDPERLNRRTVTEVVGYARPAAGFDFDGKRAHAVYEAYVSGEQPTSSAGEGMSGIFLPQ